MRGCNGSLTVTVPGEKKSQYGFKDRVTPILTTGQGLNEAVIRQISAAKHEPEWMLRFRLRAYATYRKLPLPQFGPDLSALDFEKINYFRRDTSRPVRRWEDVPAQIKETFERLGVPQAERQYLAGSSAQYESEVVYHHVQEELAQQGVVFMAMDTAVQRYPKLVRQYFGTLVPPNDNKMAALNSAAWSGGTFIYVPPHVRCTVPLQSYFRINAGNSGQFERTLIIVDEGAQVNYVEGCTAPNYSADSLHAAVVEVFVKPHATCRYTTIQNWSDNVYSLETKRAQAFEQATMEWVDGNLGSKVTMKYPSVYLDGPGARGTMLSVAFAGSDSHGNGIISDTGARMIHRAPQTSSTIVSKSLCKNGGHADYRGEVRMTPAATGAFAHVECDTLILDDYSGSDTLPVNTVQQAADAQIEHEAKVSKVSAAQLFYLMSRGLTEKQATEMIVMGFLTPFTKELPMEYAVELNRLIEYQMDGAVG